MLALLIRSLSSRCSLLRDALGYPRGRLHVSKEVLARRRAWCLRLGRDGLAGNDIALYRRCLARHLGRALGDTRHLRGTRAWAASKGFRIRRRFLGLDRTLHRWRSRYAL